MKCFICEKTDFQLIYRLKSKNILRCKNDGLFLAENNPDGSQQYGEHYFSNPPNLLNQSYFHNKLSTIKLLTSNLKPKILDVGCGWGDFEEVLEKEKIPYLGIDINKQAVEICQKKGLNCKLFNIETSSFIPSLFKEGNKGWFGFDAITLFQMIEHNKDPLPLLLSAKKLLKKNGVILITTPNNDSPLRKTLSSRWSVYNEDSHFVFYNKKTLQQTLELAGFKNIQIKTDSMRFLSFNYILQRLKQMYFPTFNLFTESDSVSLLTFNFPVPTDPWGDLQAIAVK